MRKYTRAGEDVVADAVRRAVTRANQDPHIVVIEEQARDIAAHTGMEVPHVRELLLRAGVAAGANMEFGRIPASAARARSVA